MKKETQKEREFVVVEKVLGVAVKVLALEEWLALKLVAQHLRFCQRSVLVEEKLFSLVSEAVLELKVDSE